MLKAVLGLVNLVAVLALVLFLGAGTFRFAEAWIFLGLFGGASLAITLYLAHADPALLARRTQAGAAAETQWSQKIIQAIGSLLFLSTLLVPALERRFAAAEAPLPVIVVGDAMLLLGFVVVVLVFRANTFASSVIEVASGQRVIDSGPYAAVRHPMYSGALVLVAGVPLALGSLAGLATFPPFVAVIVWRLLDEERFLTAHLAGYAAYRKRTRFRLIPYVW